MIKAFTQQRRRGRGGRDVWLMREAGVKVEDPTHASDWKSWHCCEESDVDKPPETEKVRPDPQPGERNKACSLFLELPETQTLQSCSHSCPPTPLLYTHIHTIHAFLYIEYSPLTNKSIFFLTQPRLCVSQWVQTQTTCICTLMSVDYLRLWRPEDSVNTLRSWKHVIKTTLLSYNQAPRAVYSELVRLECM